MKRKVETKGVKISFEEMKKTFFFSIPINSESTRDTFTSRKYHRVQIIRIHHRRSTRRKDDYLHVKLICILNHLQILLSDGLRYFTVNHAVL